MEAMQSFRNLAQPDPPQPELRGSPLLFSIEISHIEGRQIHRVTVNIQFPCPRRPECVPLARINGSDPISDEQFIHPWDCTFCGLDARRLGHGVITVISDELGVRVTVPINPHRTDPVTRPDHVRRSAGTQQHHECQGAGDCEDPILHFPFPKLRVGCEYNP